MAQNIKGENAIEILRQPEICKTFTDADNPVHIQVIDRLSEWFLNSRDLWKIRNAAKNDGPIAGAAELLECLIKCYKDQPEKLTLADFIEALENQNTNLKLVKMLNSAANSGTTMQKSDSSMTKNVKARLQFMCENVAKVWGKLLNETSLEKCFVEPEIVEEEMGEDGKKRRKETGKTINCYEKLFESDTFGDRIVIEGDPGMGKTTYVNKLALDWTWDENQEYYSENNHYLKSTFSIIFLIPLHSLNGGKFTTFTQAVDIQLKNCGSWLITEFQKNPTKCLLILDAFDEYDGSCSEINEIIEGTLFPYLKVVITTRPSHIERLVTKNQWLSITGLTTPEKREQFLGKQGWDKLEERDMITYVLSGLGTLWYTPLYLAMLRVLCKAKKVTNFDPRQPNCFHVLVKLFTEHIISRCVNEKGLDLMGDERLKLKSHIQQCAFQQFGENNPWLTNAINGNVWNRLTFAVKNLFGQFPRYDAEGASIQSTDTLEAKQARQIGLIIVQQEQSPVTGENVEIVSFIHQMFVEYYAAIEFGPIFTNSYNQEELVQNIDTNLDLTASPFSYFLAAECISYKQMLVKRQINCCKNEKAWYEDRTHVDININKFPWLPEIQISEEAFKEISKDITWLWFECTLYGVKSFWDIHYIKEICLITGPTKLTIDYGLLGFNVDVLDSILSSVNKIELRWCNCENINLPIDKVYQNLTEFVCHSREEADELVLLKCFPNLQKLYYSVPIVNHNELSFCDSLQNMNQLIELYLLSSHSVSLMIKLAETIEASSLCKTLKKIHLFDNILETRTESSTEILFKSISKCVQLEELILIACQMKPQSLAMLKDILQNSDNLKTSLKCLELTWVDYFELTWHDLNKWHREVELILPHCCVSID